MAHRALSILLVATALLVGSPGAALAQTILMTAGMQSFSFANDATLQNTGGENLWSSGMQLTINGVPYTGGAPTTSADGRTLTFASTTLSGLSVQRSVYVPATGSHDFARWLDVLANSSGSAVTVTVAINTSITSFGGISVTGSSSGDATVSTTDDWFTMTPGSSPFGGTNPIVGAVVQGAGATVRTATETGGPGGGPGGAPGMTWTFSTMVPPFSRISFVSFLAQHATADTAALSTDVTYLAAAPDEAMVGLDDYLDSIVNFPGDTPGAPRIRFAGATLANEGDMVEVVATVTDDGVATPTWTWDTNGDGVFGELPDATTYTVPGADAIGGVLLRIGVQATNGTAMSQRYRSIEVVNMPPTIGPPDPPTTTSSGASYGYQINAVDHSAGVLTYTCTRCPGTMTVSSGGYVSWSPSDTDVTMPAMPDHVLITVTDPGGLPATLMWDLTVLADHPPGRPSTIYPNGIAVASLTPRLVAGNATDADGDLLTYLFELDTVDTFDSPGRLVSPPVAQTDGYTAWTPTAALQSGTPYFWRVHANDGVADGESAMTSFFTAGTPPPRDAGAPDGSTLPDGGMPPHDGGTVPPPRGGCSIASGAPDAGFLAIFGVVAVLGATRRRRAGA